MKHPASPNAVRACKKLLQGIAETRASDEGKEGVQSFLGKRKPSWLPA